MKAAKNSKALLVRNGWCRCMIAWALMACPALIVMPLRAQNIQFGSCYARWTDTELIVGNSHIERKWSIEGDVLHATSLYDRDAKVEWLNAPAGQQMAASKERIEITAYSGTFSPVESPSLRIDVASKASLHYRFRVFPEAKGVEIELQPEEPKPAMSKSVGPLGSTGASIIEQEARELSDGTRLPNTPDELSLIPQHLRLTQVSFSTDTDIHNQLVSSREWMFMNNEENLALQGNLFFVEDVLTGKGLLFLKQAPLPEARTIQTVSDLEVVAKTRTFRFVSPGYSSVVLAYSGGRDGRIQTLQDYQRQIRNYVPGRDGVLLTNTWGDRNRDLRINSAFIKQEISAGAKLGVDVVQIDDGWQAGRSVNSGRGPGVANAFWSTEKPFWAADAERFPGGLAPLVALCSANGMKLGLWYAPDSSQDFVNWQRDADLILEMYHKEGISYFKFDSINMSSIEAEKNLGRLFERILTGSNGAITIDLDVTGSGRRPGYFGVMNSGPIFVENRYTDFHRYWPHLTLRNLWELSQYVDPLRLRMEFLNNTRNESRYSDDPLAPSRYTADAIFATVMFSNPLGWFETSNLPPAFDTSVTPLIATWKKERASLYEGTMIPIGADPDGVSWTGFASIGRQRTTGYMLIFRELNDQSDWSSSIPLMSGTRNKITVLAGHGTAEIAGGKVNVHIPEKLQYLWIRLDERGQVIRHKAKVN
jgi:alpha-galactosidase